ncbi:MAG TPA: DUF5652 family protein [Candidatus Paceibacterota bacterium]|nr:DUF5652 family protein [Candidatus Paceibacterota bacterium]
MHDFSPLYSPAYSPFAFGFMSALVPFLILAMLWTIVLKGFALWHAARGGQKWWFIALLVVNTLGLLEIIYLIWFRPTASHRSHAPAHESSTQA